MPFVPKTDWEDLPSTATPVTAAELTRLEQGVSDVFDIAEAPVTAADISDASATGQAVLTAASQAAARTAIGAGTSSLALGATSSTAAAGDHTHAGLTADAAAGTASIRTLGTGATQAAAGNHTHSNLVPTTRTVNGAALSANVVLDGGDILATGYVGVAAAPVAATDTLNAAIAKLE